MRTFWITLMAGLSMPVFAHPGHGLVTPHLHNADGYLLLGFGIALIGALAACKLK